MKSIKYITIGILLISTLQSSVQAQILPISSIIRFGNTFYCQVDSLNTFYNKGINFSYGKKIENRYIDIIIKNDSIGIIISDSIIFFSQKSVKEPGCYKKIIFYKRRVLNNSDLRIKYIKLLEYRDKKLYAQAKLSRKKSSQYNKKELIVINAEDIKGVFIGPGEDYRNFLLSIGIISAFGGCIILL